MTLVTSWSCVCGADNHAEHTECRKCKRPRPRAPLTGGCCAGRGISGTPEIPGRRVVKSLGIVTSTAILGMGMFRDIAAGVRDIVGGRSRAYENELNAGVEEVLREAQEKADGLGANALVGVHLDYEAIGNSMLMISAQGTAVIVEPGTLDT